MKRFFVAAIVMAASAVAMAQGTAEDYQRAFGIWKQFSNDKLTGRVESIRWADGKTVTYAVRTADGELERREVDTDARQPHAVDPAEAGDRWKGGSQGQRGNRRESLMQTKVGPQKVEGHWMNVDEQRVGRPAVSPDSSRVAYIRDYNVWVSDRDGKNAKQLSQDGTLSHYYSAYLQWSPDGRYVAVNKVRPVEKRYVYYVESSPTTQLQPILHQQEYAKPGDERQQEHPCVFEVETGRAIVPSNELFPTPYDINGPRWSEDSHCIYFEYNERGHKIYRVLAVDVKTGDVSIVVEERSDKFVNYSRLHRQTLSGGKQMLWTSERDNWNHIYLVDLGPTSSKGSAKGTGKAKGGKAVQTVGYPIRQVTKGEWVVRRVLRVDEEKGIIFFTASGVNKDEDPYLVHYYKIGMDGKNMVCLTPENGNHEAQFNEDYTYLVDTYSRMDEAPVTVLRSVENPDQVTELGRVDLSRLEATGWQRPEVFHAPGRDGKTEMWGVVWRPTNFDPSKKYPVIEYIYSGPGDAYTPKSFTAYSWTSSALAELGFVVVQLDAMGTSYRGKAFEEVCYKNLKDAGFPDRILWIKALAEKYPYLDLDNVGIFGCSAGGQESTAAMLWHGDFYKAAYSACGCHDNRMDKIWWNEQWMGYPVDSSYIECSNVENAHRLKGALMLVVGEMDDNVDPASTMQVVNALIKANKDFELVVLPGAHHTMGESYGEHKRFDFFVKNLLHKMPPAW